MLALHNSVKLTHKICNRYFKLITCDFVPQVEYDGLDVHRKPFFQAISQLLKLRISAMVTNSFHLDVHRNEFALYYDR